MCLGSRYNKERVGDRTTTCNLGLFAVSDIRSKLILNSNPGQSRGSITSVSVVQSFEILHRDIAMLCAESQKDWVTAKYVMCKRDFVRFGLNMRFEWTPYIAQPPGCPWTTTTYRHNIQELTRTAGNTWQAYTHVARSPRLPPWFFFKNVSGKMSLVHT